jgi:hypothetical protein
VPAKGQVTLTFTRANVSCTGVVLHTHACDEDEEEEDLLEDPNTVRLDTCADVNLFFNNDLLTDVETAQAPLEICGINPSEEAQPMIATEAGDFTELDVAVHYHPDASGNILSFALVQKVNPITYVERQMSSL